MLAVAAVLHDIQYITWLLTVELRLLMVKLKAHRVNWRLMFSVIVVGRITRCRRQTACGRRARSTAAHQITASTPRNAKWTTKTA